MKIYRISWGCIYCRCCGWFSLLPQRRRFQLLVLAQKPRMGKNNRWLSVRGELVRRGISNIRHQQPLPQSQWPIVDTKQRSMCRVPCDQPPNETDDSGQTDLSGRLDERVFGVFDGATSHSDPDNLRLRGRRPGSHRRRSGRPKWRPFLQRRGGLWFTALS